MPSKGDHKALKEELWGGGFFVGVFDLIRNGPCCRAAVWGLGSSLGTFGAPSHPCRRLPAAAMLLDRCV